jgi:hypothetical protein
MPRLSDSRVADIAKDFNVAVDDLIQVPSLGTDLNYINASLQSHLYNLIEKHGYEVVSIKTADVDFTYTHGNRKNSANIEYDTKMITTFNGKPVKTNSSVVTRFRLGTVNFFRVGDLTKLHIDMSRAVKQEILARISCFMNDDICKKVEGAIDKRIIAGTAFQISSIITRCKKTGKTQHWHRKQAGGVFKMVLYAFKGAPCDEYVIATEKNRHLWEKHAGDLWQDDCISISTTRNGLTCAYLAMKAY